MAKTSRIKQLQKKGMYLDPVKRIEERDGLVRIEIEFERRFENKRAYRPLLSVVERILPATQVTFEVIK